MKLRVILVSTPMGLSYDMKLIAKQLREKAVKDWFDSVKPSPMDFTECFDNPDGTQTFAAVGIPSRDFFKSEWQDRHRFSRSDLEFLCNRCAELGGSYKILTIDPQKEMMELARRNSHLFKARM